LFKKFCIFVVLTLLSPAMSWALLIAPNATTFNLDNGLQVIVIPDRRAPVITQMLWYRVGSADEPVGQSGIAHFLEHLMFKGTQKVADGEFAKFVAEVGGRDNAFTSTDYTAYFQRFAKQHLRTMMDYESDRMTNLVLTEAQLVLERDVILEERRSRVEDNPGAKLREAVSAALYLNHPYGRPVLGWAQEMATLNLPDTMAFYRKHYAPGNAILVITGDVDLPNLRQLIDQTYGQIAAVGAIEPRKRPVEPIHRARRVISLSDENVRQRSVQIRFLVPSSASADGNDASALNVLANILGGGTVSRLHKQLVLKEERAANVGAGYSGGGLDYGSFSLFARPVEGQELAELGELVEAELDLIRNDGVTIEEVDRAKRSMIASTIYAQDSQRGLANYFGAALSTGLTLEQAQRLPDRIDAVTADDVQRVARTWLRPTHSILAYLLRPEDQEASQ
jgi:zinc protease